jgi:hypothetical protein
MKLSWSRPERRAARPVQRRQAAPELLVEVGRLGAGGHQLEHQELRASSARDGHHLGDPQRARLAEPGEAARLRREHAPAARSLVLAKKRRPSASVTSS